ncbi:MAG: CRISPR-associated endoribonuclease Cas6, partial [Ktedonobacteraceae bacterium]|nr:CRISPR-associated endoribonuclease Cas6 [Ktedonobacteraceae bacterium]
MKEGELFSLLLRLHPVAPGQVAPGAGNQVQAAFLDMVRQGDTALAERLHLPNQRRPYTLSLLKGFNHLSPEQLSEAIQKNHLLDVLPGQVYWLRFTMLDTSVFSSFMQHLILKPRELILRLGEAQFEVSRLLATPEPVAGAPSWVAYSSFAAQHAGLRHEAQSRYHFEFTSPTAFSMGQRQWSKLLTLFPEPADVFESLARQWEAFAPEHLRLAGQGLTPQALAAWCAEQIIVTRYRLETCYLPQARFGQTGFIGEIDYEVKGSRAAAEARWLTPLAQFALFGGVGYKTAMGMGQA